jgi:hypothetical protein
MSTTGISTVVLTTHNWGKTAKFLQSLGFTLDFETDHNSGQLRGPDGPPVFVVEVPADQPVETRVVLGVPDAAAFTADPALAVEGEFAATHWGTRDLTVRDPDGRGWTLSAPATGA